MAKGAPIRLMPLFQAHSGRDLSSFMDQTPTHYRRLDFDPHGCVRPPLTLNGLKVALLDGEASVRPCVDSARDPEPHSPFVIRRISIENTKYLGRTHDGQLQPLALALNPGFNAIIGGRGTGKSSIVELIRRATKREAACCERWIRVVTKSGRPATVYHRRNV